MKEDSKSRRWELGWDAVLAIVSAVTLLIAVISQFQTNSYLERQQKEEVLKNRAYLSVAMGNDPSSLNYQITNSGITPAYNLKIETIINYADGSFAKPTDEGSTNAILNPGQKVISSREIDKNKFETITGLEVKIIFTDYSGEKRNLNNYYTGIPGFFTIKNQTAD